MFDEPNSIGSLLGFRDILVPLKTTFIGKDIQKIIPFDMKNIHFNLADGMFVKDNQYFHSETNVIACFKPILEFGEPIIYEPKYPLFMPVHYNKQKIVCNCY
jgi:hypothetical protein